MKNEKKSKDKDPHAVALGTLGGKKGGKARARRLSPVRRSEIASRAATARWKKEDALSKRVRETSKPEVENTRQRILAAAHKAFTEVGLAGARVDRIAESAGVNKRMLYHYFESKEGLFREMVRRNLLELSEAEAIAPKNFGEALVFWQELLRMNPDWIRISLWEALSYGSEEIIGEDERRPFWQKAVGEVRQEQLTGNIASELDSDLLQLYLFALVAFPLMLPQLTKIITGQSPDEQEFLQRQRTFLRNFGELLKPSDER